MTETRTGVAKSVTAWNTALECALGGSRDSCITQFDAALRKLAREPAMIAGANGRVPPDTLLRTDVCIVGGGPVGLALATELASPTCRVVLLESGGAEAATSEGLTGGESAGELWQPLSDTRARGLGGTSALWTDTDQTGIPGGLRSYQLTDLDFSQRSWVPNSGWPFGAAELTRHYEGAAALLAVEPFGGTPGSSPGMMFEAAVARFSLRSAVDALETAAMNSPYIDTLLNATVLRLEGDADGVRCAIVRSGESEFRVSARVFVLAAGGIENARLLLLSDSYTPGGIGNHHDNVGRYFMEHLTVMQGTLSFTPEAGVEHVGTRSEKLQAGWRLTSESAEQERLLGVVLWPIPASRLAIRNAYYNPWSRLVRSPRPLLLARLRRPDRLARFAFRSASGLRQPGRQLLHAHIEQPPRRDNRVTLSDRVDDYGQRQARVEWRMATQERDSLLRTLSLFDATLRDAKVGRLSRLPDASNFSLLVEQSHHHMGTTRMHIDPRQGVVDADCRVHGVSNLFVAGSSVMPTGGAATVTLTSIALALRLADHLKTGLTATVSAAHA